MSSLPQPTTDLASAKGDLDEHGYGVLNGLLGAEEIAEMQAREPQLATEEDARALHDQAQGETDNQYIFMMINKQAVTALPTDNHRFLLWRRWQCITRNKISCICIRIFDFFTNP